MPSSASSEKPPAKPKKPSSPSKASKPEKPDADELDVFDAPKLGATLTHLRAAWPPLTSNERAAFRALISNEQRSQLGKQTKAEGVLAEGVRWAVLIDEQLRLHPTARDHYAEARFAYFLERLRALHDRLNAERQRQSEIGAARGVALSKREIALRARKRLLRRMETFAGRRAAERDAIEHAAGTTSADDNLAQSIAALAKLATSFLERGDEISKVLLKTAGLASSFVDSALTAAKALGAASSGALLAGPSASRDSLLVNVDEGDVLFEMETAMDLFDDAREDDPSIAKLTPGAATRSVLGPRKAIPTKPKPEPSAPKAEGSTPT